MSSNDEKKVSENTALPDETLNAIAGGAGPDANGNFICPHCREYALKLGEDGMYHCSYCEKTSQHPF